MSNVTENTWNGLKKRLFYLTLFILTLLIFLPESPNQVQENLIVQSAAGVLLGILITWDPHSVEIIDSVSNVKQEARFCFNPGLTNLKCEKP